MRLDQFEKLQRLGEKVLDVFLLEADPENWPGKGIKPGDMDAKTRGDVFWTRKTAVSAAVLYNRIEGIVGRMEMLGAGSATPPRDPEEEERDAERTMEDEIKSAEKEARALLDELQYGGGKKAFD